MKKQQQHTNKKTASKILTITNSLHVIYLEILLYIYRHVCLEPFDDHCSGLLCKIEVSRVLRCVH